MAWGLPTNRGGATTNRLEDDARSRLFGFNGAVAGIITAGAPLKRFSSLVGLG
jgi:hypothetical protein